MSDASPHNSEWLTRKHRIDPILNAVGWPFVAGQNCGATAHRIEEYETSNGPADYALGFDSNVVGIVEAKKLTLGPQNVLTQAERYSRGASANGYNFSGFYVPFLYSTNGEVIWFRDARHSLNRSRRVATFHTPGALRDLLSRDFDSVVRALAALPNDHPRLRPYQRDANAAVEKAIADRKREMMIAQATGCGKTFQTVNQVYRLMKSGVAKRILFLVDRRALAAQAVRAFKSFEPEPGLKFDQIYELFSQRFQQSDFGDDEKFDPTVLPQHYLTDPQPGHAFVYVCTIQRMAMNILGRNAAGVFGAEGEASDEDADKITVPIHAFDVVIADECHRGYSAGEVSAWRDTLNHFDAIKIGLTATPASHTLAYFKEIVYRYDYERAVREGYLVDYDVVKINSDVRLKGVFLNEGERVTIVDPSSGTENIDELEDQRQFEPTEVERAITSPDSNRKIVAEFKKYATEHEQRYGRFPKTLIFAANDLPHTSHADQIVTLMRDAFGRGDGFVSKITGRVDRPLQRIREFRNRPEPGIAVSVDLMSTGVDIPDLEMIVFLRSIQSRILFEQMLGRGTRRGEKFPDKSHFTAFDCFGGTLIERFSNATGITAQAPIGPTRAIAEIIDDIWRNVDRDYNIRCLVKRLQRIDKEMDRSKACPKFEEFGIADGDLGKYTRALPSNLERAFHDAMALLRNADFQNLLITYPRPPKRFIVAEEHQDTVTSEWIVRGADGKELKPADYLAAFSQFVKDNPQHIAAIEILLDRPREWSTVALKELREKLTRSPEKFTPDLLQKAYAVAKGKALVDIISMVKHAGAESQPLLTAEERVNQALDKLMAGKAFTPQQQKWIDRIRQHLIVNLTIEKDDFDGLPVFADFGGWGKANQDFSDTLMPLIQEINTYIAA
ncbi:MAG TPA: type I restriction-modification enzyme R subunit C-terminal domain-containing protein [Tepidisphaeraceae bacterium]|jgi:type I restriction enzyme R subunit